MCDYFWHRTNTSADQGGDLADIVRSVAGAAAPSTSSPDPASWQFLPHPASSSPLPHQLPTEDFADGFGLRDPLLDELALFDGGGGGGSDKSATDAAPHQKLLVGDETKRPCSDLFSAVLQISPAKPSPLSPRAATRPPLPMVADDSVKLEHGVQISSPRTPGIKRRKSQAKKVVCIPAPAAASSRPSGEVVPSDLWAWRKYGQKPIKGSPYPRGYYRCSSSKGCSARKQVERSRTDPNMLVITYTSEHNHPWPTQRNALAGSTRSQPSKNSSSAAKSSSSSSSQCNLNQALKEEQQPKERAAASSSTLPTVKEEVIGSGGGGEMENVATVGSSPLVNDNAFDSVFYYDEPVISEHHPAGDFFADLAELEQDPMSLIFSGPGFDKSKEEEEEQEEEEEGGSNKGMDQFINMFDWGAGGT